MIRHRKSKLVTFFFRHMTLGKFRKSFHRFSLTTRSEKPRFEPGVPAIVIVNHPSWWDALMVGYVSENILGRDYFGMFDPEQLERYGIFRQLGGVALDLRGKAEGSQAHVGEMVEFLRYLEGELEGRDRVFWVFAQGDLVSAERPIALKRGFASIAARFERVHVVKLTWSYDFWFESKPEAVIDILPMETLVNFRGKAAMEEFTSRAESDLEASRLFVRETVRDRRRDRLQTLWESPAGANPVYDAYRWAKAFLTGQKFNRSHARQS